MVAGFGYLPGDILFHATLWKSSTSKMIDLGTVGTDTCSYAAWINAAEQIVGGSHPGCGPDTTRAFLWEKGSMFDLNTLIPPGSALYLDEAEVINDRGEISALGTDVSGNGHAVLLLPCDENHRGVASCDYAPADTQTAAEVYPAVLIRPDSTRSLPLRRMHSLGHRPGN